MPSFVSGEDYKTGVREKMLKAGWKPARSKEADSCGSAEVICDEYDEYESHTEKEQTSFRWQRSGKIVEILTAGKDSFAYNGYEFEKNSMTIAQNERWESFWAKFKTAIDKKDSADLEQMMARDFYGTGDDGPPSQWVEHIERNNQWKVYRESIGGGTKSDKRSGLYRTTKDGFLIFEYKRADWRWAGIGGEGGGDKF